MAGTKQVTYNHDVAGIVRKLDRFIFELIHSASANTSQWSEFDKVRLNQYLGCVRSYHSWVIAQPALDLVETSPRPYELDDPFPIPRLENDDVYDVLNLLEIARIELINSQSSRDPCNIKGFDSARLLSIIGKVEAFMQNYVGPITPIDLPESTPVHPMESLGRVGV